MSKAFTRESDDLPERPARPRPTTALPPGTKNLLTPDGAQRLRAELERLQQEEQAEASTAASEGVGETGDLARARRIQHLQQCLQTAVVTPPPAPPWEQVRFGATVTVRKPGGEETRYRIVGVDEMDVDRDWVSWLSPIARALLNARLGQRVRFKFPAGEEELEITSIAFE